MMMFDHGWVASTIVFWAAIVLFVFIGSFFSYRTRVSQHRMLEKIVASGQALTPELLSKLERSTADRRSNPVRSGILLICIGFAIAVFLWAMEGGSGLFQGEEAPNWLPLVGIFPFMIGVAKLLGVAADRRRGE
jgi:hypothetical protein